MNGVDPQAWLTDALGRIASHPAHRLDELLPWDPYGCHCGPGGLIMSPVNKVSHVFTIAHVAEMLGESEDWLWAQPSRPGEFHPEPLTGRVEDWRAGLDRDISRPCHVSGPLHVARNVRFSRITRPHLLHAEAYGTYPAGTGG